MALGLVERPHLRVVVRSRETIQLHLELCRCFEKQVALRTIRPSRCSMSDGRFVHCRRGARPRGDPVRWCRPPSLVEPSRTRISPASRRQPSASGRRCWPPDEADPFSGIPMGHQVSLDLFVAFHPPPAPACTHLHLGRVELVEFFLNGVVGSSSPAPECFLLARHQRVVHLQELVVPWTSERSDPGNKLELRLVGIPLVDAPPRQQPSPACRRAGSSGWSDRQRGRQATPCGRDPSGASGLIALARVFDSFRPLNGHHILKDGFWAGRSAGR